MLPEIRKSKENVENGVFISHIHMINSCYIII